MASTNRSTPQHASLRRAWRHAAAVAGATTAITLGLGSGAAWAYFAASGTGTGHATVGHLDPLTLVGTGTTSGPLFPGETADLHLSIKNPNAFPVTITGVAPNGTVTVIVPGGNGCTATNSALAVTSAVLAITVPATASTFPITIPNGVSMGTGSYTGCQMATFHIPLTVTERS